MLEIQVEDSTDYTVCRPVGELDAYTVGQFRESLADLASTASCSSTSPRCRSWTPPAWAP